MSRLIKPADYIKGISKKDYSLPRDSSWIESCKLSILTSLSKYFKRIMFAQISAFFGSFPFYLFKIPLWIPEGL